ncbi:hypothetical protein [Nocardia sp. XZ_19_369]|uniref:hypothetical protein n=1 Tax=Nocardia sp. XZ_19_369 TaxID=2769487 RepID=UPI00188E5F16|nr:hypothetical protein [Nocardia sp. XZ_19_369]
MPVALLSCEIDYLSGFTSAGDGALSGDGYDSERRGFDSNERGRIFETGTDRHFRDRENGYVPDPRKYEHGPDKIQFDKIKVENGQISTVEDKSGRIGGPKDEKQLEVVYELIKKGEINHHTLRSVEREVVSERCQQLIDKIREEFPNKFTHLQISRSDAREIWARGLELERRKQLEKEGKAVQLELPGVVQKAREQKGVDLQKRREKIADIAKLRDRKERARERLANIRQIVKTREEADRARAAGEAAARRVALEFPASEHLRRIEAPTADRVVAREAPDAVKAALVAQVERDAARLAARDFPFPVSDKSREQQTVEIGERTTPDIADAACVEREAADKARAAEKEQQARQAAQERARAMEQVQLHGISPEVRNLLALGQAHPPTAAVETKPGYAPGVERGGTGQGRDPRTPEIGPRTQ